MAKIDHEKVADRILIAVGKKPKDADERKPEGDEDEDADKPGKCGRMAIAAFKHGDGVAFEEAIRRIRD